MKHVSMIFRARPGFVFAAALAISLRVVLQDQYNNIPSPGKERNNLQLVAGVAVNL